MPRLRKHTADVGGAVPSGSRRATAGMFGGQQAAALGSLANTGMQVSNQLVQIQERRDKLAAQRDAAVLREQAVRHLDELRQTGEPVGEKFNEFLESRIQGLREERTTHEGMMWAERVSSNIQSELGSAARRVDAELAGEEAKQATRETMQSNGVFLQSAPEVLPEILTEQRDLIEELDIPENMKEPLLREMNASAARNAAMGWISVDPRSAKEMIEEGRFDAHITPDDRVQLISRADTRIRALEQSERTEQLELERRRAMESTGLMNEALVDLHSAEPDERLTTEGIASLAEQTFADGTPILSPSQVDRLFNLHQQKAEQGAIRSDPGLMIDLIGRLDRVSADELQEHALDGDLSVSDYRWMMEHVQTGATPLRQARSTALKNIPSYLDSYADLLTFRVGYGRMLSQATIQVREREEEYREAGKSPIEYYRDGTFEADMRQLGQDTGVLNDLDRFTRNLEQVSAGREVDPAAEERGIQIGSQVRGFVYIGGPVNDTEGSWMPVEELD